MSQKESKFDIPPEELFAPITEGQEKELMGRLAKARTKLLALVPFFGHLCLNFKPRVAKSHDRVGTAAVAPDGSLILNYAFCKRLTDAEMCGLLCHEVLHPALFCWMRQGSRKAIVMTGDGMPFSLWNLAHDLSFNPEIVELAERSEAKDAVALPEGAAIDAKFKGMSAEEIYDQILEEAQKNPSKGGGAGILMNMPGGGHSIGDDLRPDLSSTDEGKRAAAGDQGAKQKIENDWRVNVVAAAQVQEQEKGRGTLPGGLQKLVDELVDPKVDWRDVLSRWIGENGRRQDYTYRRPARRSESVGEYLPSLQKFGVSDVVILWDTSGSMNGRETEILSETQGICEDLGLSLRVICCDTMIHSDVDNIQDALDIIPHIKGGGGSDFTPAFDLLEQEQYDGVVVAFTDGYIGVPSAKPHLIKDVLWVLNSRNVDVDPTGGKWGEVLVINDEPVGAGR
jgi:predicted metal-dependent peptidase